MATAQDKKILQELQAAVRTSLKARGFAERQPQGLFAPIEYTLQLGGKRIRPMLCLAAAYAFAPERWHEALPAAAALEIFHNFTLLHDDLMDRSPLRRGQETVYRKWDDNTAILSGDAMCIEAYAALGELEAKALQPELFGLFSRMALEVCVGQQLDMDFEHRSDVAVAEYLEMIRLKTSVLLGASLQIGALLGGASSEAAERLYRIGVELGLAFQIQDDLLDVYGDEATFGKPIGGDIVNAKKTLLLLYTEEQLQGAQREELQRLLALSPEERKGRIAEVRALYDAVGVRAYAEGEVARLSQSAYSSLEELSTSAPELTPEHFGPLRLLFDSLSGRTH